MGMSWKSHHVLGAPFKMPPVLKCQLVLMENQLQFHQ
jgi:hypothetical protein